MSNFLSKICSILQFFYVRARIFCALVSIKLLRNIRQYNIMVKKKQSEIRLAQAYILFPPISSRAWTSHLPSLKFNFHISYVYVKVKYVVYRVISTMLSGWNNKKTLWSFPSPHIDNFTCDSFCCPKQANIITIITDFFHPLPKPHPSYDLSLFCFCLLFKEKVKSQWFAIIFKSLQ